jgi:hypothetical protein
MREKEVDEEKREFYPCAHNFKQRLIRSTDFSKEANEEQT